MRPKPMVDDRRAADPVAHPEDLFATRHQRFHHLLRIQGLHDQGVLRELLSCTCPTSPLIPAEAIRWRCIRA
jgi:hypothetical protein